MLSGSFVRARLITMCDLACEVLYWGHPVHWLSIHQCIFPQTQRHSWLDGGSIKKSPRKISLEKIACASGLHERILAKDYIREYRLFHEAKQDYICHQKKQQMCYKIKPILANKAIKILLKLQSMFFYRFNSCCF